MTPLPPRRAFVFLCLSLAAAAPALAQSGQGELTGQVLAEAGGPVGDCKVTATDTATMTSVSVAATPQGVYNVPFLRPGLYRVTAEAPGFRTSVRDGIQVLTGERVRVDLALAIGAFSEATTVVAEAPLLQTESTSLGGTI